MLVRGGVQRPLFPGHRGTLPGGRLYGLIKRWWPTDIALMGSGTTRRLTNRTGNTCGGRGLKRRGGLEGEKKKKVPNTVPPVGQLVALPVSRRTSTIRMMSPRTGTDRTQALAPDVLNQDPNLLLQSFVRLLAVLSFVSCKRLFQLKHKGCNRHRSTEHAPNTFWDDAFGTVTAMHTYPIGNACSGRIR